MVSLEDVKNKAPKSCLERFLKLQTAAPAGMRDDGGGPNAKTSGRGDLGSSKKRNCFHIHQQLKSTRYNPQMT